MVWPPYAARDLGKLMHGLIPGKSACWKWLGTSEPRIYLLNLKLNSQRSRTGGGLMELHYKSELERIVVVLRRTLVEARVCGARCSLHPRQVLGLPALEAGQPEPRGEALFCSIFLLARRSTSARGTPFSDFQQSMVRECIFSPSRKSTGTQLNPKLLRAVSANDDMCIHVEAAYYL